jgi:hypothetical protein
MGLSHFVFEAKKHTPVVMPRQAHAVTMPAQASAMPAQAVAVESKIIDAENFEPRSDLKKKMVLMSEAERETAGMESEVPQWKTCQYLKPLGQKTMCSQYLSLCVQDKCQKRYMQADFYDFKKYTKSGKSIK